MHITIEEQKEVLDPIAAGIAGVTKVYQSRPKALQSRDLVACTIVPGPARYRQDDRGSQHVTITRRWFLRLYIEEWLAGREFQLEQAVDPFLTRVVDQLAQYPVITLDDGRSFNLSVDGGGDTGARQMVYADQTYAGVEVEFDTITEDVVDPL